MDVYISVGTDIIEKLSTLSLSMLINHELMSEWRGDYAERDYKYISIRTECQREKRIGSAGFLLQGLIYTLTKIKLTTPSGKHMNFENNSPKYSTQYTYLSDWI